MSYMIVNGKIVDKSSVKVDFEDRGFQFGDGIYEVIRIYNGKPFAIESHIQRLFESATKIELTIPYPKEAIIELIEKLLEKEKKTICNLYLQISRGVSIRNHIIPKEITPTFIAYFLEGERPLSLMKDGTKVTLVEDTRWFHCDIKSISLLGNVLAKHKAIKAGCTEAVLHRGDTITEASASNVFIIKDGLVKTHPANHLILNGITRQRVIAICKENSIPYSETAFTKDEFFAADEAFLSSTTVEVLPIIKADEKRIGNGQPGPLTKFLQQLFVKDIEGECGTLSIK